MTLAGQPSTEERFREERDDTPRGTKGMGQQKSVEGGENMQREKDGGAMETATSLPRPFSMSFDSMHG